MGHGQRQREQGVHAAQPARSRVARCGRVGERELDRTGKRERGSGREGKGEEVVGREREHERDEPGRGGPASSRPGRGAAAAPAGARRAGGGVWSSCHCECPLVDFQDSRSVGRVPGFLWPLIVAGFLRLRARPRVL